MSMAASQGSANKGRVGAVRISRFAIYSAVQCFYLREYDLFALRANIGVIFQRFVRYHFSAVANVAIGRIDARSGHQRIVDDA